MKNKYEIRGNVTAIIINSPKHGRKETLISTSKLEKVKSFPNSWYVNKMGNTFYVMGHPRKANGKRTTVFIHRFITDAPEELMIDHIDHNGLNNTDDNLRLATRAENGQNRRGPAANNKSGVRGVIWDRKNSMWTVRVTNKRHQRHIGSYETIAAAEQAAIEARFKYLPFSNENI